MVLSLSGRPSRRSRATVCESVPTFFPRSSWCARSLQQAAALRLSHSRAEKCLHGRDPAAPLGGWAGRAIPKAHPSAFRRANPWTFEANAPPFIRVALMVEEEYQVPDPNPVHRRAV